MSRYFGEYGKQRHAALGNSPNVLERRMLSSCFTLLFILGPFVENSCCFLSTIYFPAVSTFLLHLSFRVGSSRAPVAFVATTHFCNCILLPRYHLGNFRRDMESTWSCLGVAYGYDGPNANTEWSETDDVTIQPDDTNQGNVIVLLLLGIAHTAVGPVEFVSPILAYDEGSTWMLQIHTKMSSTPMQSAGSIFMFSQT